MSPSHAPTFPNPIEWLEIQKLLKNNVDTFTADGREFKVSRYKRGEERWFYIRAAKTIVPVGHFSESQIKKSMVTTA